MRRECLARDSLLIKQIVPSLVRHHELVPLYTQNRYAGPKVQVPRASCEMSRKRIRYRGVYRIKFRSPWKFNYLSTETQLFTIPETGNPRHHECVYLYMDKHESYQSRYGYATLRATVRSVVDGHLDSRRLAPIIGLFWIGTCCRGAARASLFARLG